jgi:ABC-2 type transport system permease protein
MMRLTLTATPRRGRVLLAKTAVVSALTLVAGTIATFAAFFLGQAILGSYGVPTASLGDGDVLRAVAGGSALTPVLPIIAIALAILLRSAAGAITAVLGVVLAPAIFGPLLPAWGQEHVLAYLPGAATDSLSIAQLEENVTTIAPGLAGIAVALWLAAFLAAAQASLMRRDA